MLAHPVHVAGKHCLRCQHPKRRRPGWSARDAHPHPFARMFGDVLDLAVAFRRPEAVVTASGGDDPIGHEQGDQEEKNDPSQPGIRGVDLYHGSPGCRRRLRMGATRIGTVTNKMGTANPAPSANAAGLVASPRRAPHRRPFHSQIPATMSSVETTARTEVRPTKGTVPNRSNGPARSRNPKGLMGSSPRRARCHQNERRGGAHPHSRYQEQESLNAGNGRLACWVVTHQLLAQDSRCRERVPCSGRIDAARRTSTSA
jgi:hypothetical protein